MIISFLRLYDISETTDHIDVKRCRDVEIDDVSSENCFFDTNFEKIIFYVK